MADQISGEEEKEVREKKTNFFLSLNCIGPRKSRGNEAKEIRLEKIFHYRCRRVVFNIFYKVVPYRYSNTYNIGRTYYYTTRINKKGAD